MIESSHCCISSLREGRREREGGRGERKREGGERKREGGARKVGRRGWIRTSCMFPDRRDQVHVEEEDE